MAIAVGALCAILQRPERATALRPNEWTVLVDLARKTNLLGTLAERMNQAGIAARCNADRHLAGARQLSERQRRSVRWELQAVHDALGEVAAPAVLLKGAAYVMGEHDNARGRLFGDIDLLVPPDRLGDVELRLMVNGWAPAVTEEYDDRYYRRWMHELPPMAHVRRGTVIDVHHTILPPTARLKPNPARIITRARSLAELPGMRVPCPEDLIVHSIVHLVHEGSLDSGLRDLYDVLCLLEKHASDPDFSSRLQACCGDHGVTEPVAMGLRLLKRFFKLSEPANRTIRFGVQESRCGYGPVAEWLFYRAIAAPENQSTWMRLLQLAIYIRAHWLRMPPRLLSRHLMKKLLLRLRAKPGAPSGGNAP